MIRMKLAATVLLLTVLGLGAENAPGDIVSIGASKDNSMFEQNQTNSNGAGSYFFAGRGGINNGNALLRGLIAFDVAGNIPNGATIDSVSLSLHLSRSQPTTQTVNLHAASQDWGEGGSNSDPNFPGPGTGSPAQPGDATWLHTFFPGSTWTNPGGDFNPFSSASQSVGFVPGFFEWSGAGMVTDVQNWLDNPSNNFGWVVLGEEGGALNTAKRFDSHENATIAFRPMLTVTFTPVPEPSTVLFGAIFLGGLSYVAWRRRRLIQ